MRNKGFTLIEMIVTLGIFSILLVTVLAVFMRGFVTQRQVLEMQAVQRDGSYIMEILSRDIRMAQDFPSIAPGESSTSLTFKDHAGNNVTYALSGDNFMINGAQANASDVKITSLRFYSNDNPDGDYSRSEPLITVVMSVQSRKNPAAIINLETSVAMRLYYLHA